jgi:hypothetical protein
MFQSFLDLIDWIHSQNKVFKVSLIIAFAISFFVLYLIIKYGFKQKDDHKKYSFNENGCLMFDGVLVTYQPRRHRDRVTCVTTMPGKYDYISTIISLGLINGTGGTIIYFLIIWGILSNIFDRE